jgi:hypothetical protein
MAEETWIAITADHAREALSDGEYEIFSTFAVAPGGSPVMPGCIRRVVNRIRGEVAASGRYSLGPDGTLPPELESAAIHLLRREAASRVPAAGIVIDDLRQAALADAGRQLDRVREGKAGITPPLTISTTAPPRDSGAWGSGCSIDFSKGPP